MDTETQVVASVQSAKLSCRLQTASIGHKGEGLGRSPSPYFCMNPRIYDRELENAGRRLGNVSQLLLDRPWSAIRCRIPTRPPTPTWPDRYWRQVQAQLRRRLTRIDTERRPD